MATPTFTGTSFSLDEVTNQISRATASHDLYFAHPTVWVVVFIGDDRDFSSQVVTYQGFEWTVVSYKKIQQQDGFMYSLYLFPKKATEIVTRSHQDTRTLAALLGVRLTRTSSNIAFDPPYSNIMLAPLILKYREQSAKEVSKKREALLLYYTGDGLISNSFQDQLRTSPSQRISSADFPPGVMSAEFAFVDQKNYNQYVSAHPPQVKDYTSYYATLFDYYVTLKMPSIFSVGGAYTFDSSIGQASRMGSFLCLKATYDSAKAPYYWEYLFGKVTDA